MEKEDIAMTSMLNSPTDKEKIDTPVQKEEQEKEDYTDRMSAITPSDEMEGNTNDIQKEEEKKNIDDLAAKKEGGASDYRKAEQEHEQSTPKIVSDNSNVEKPEGEKLDFKKQDSVENAWEVTSPKVGEDGNMIVSGINEQKDKMDRSKELSCGTEDRTNGNLEDVSGEEAEPVFDGTEVPGMEANRRMSTHSLDLDTETQESVWPKKAVALKNFVREKSAVAVSTVLRRLSGKSDDGAQDNPYDEGKDENFDKSTKEVSDSLKESEAQEASQKTGEKSGWNPCSLIKISRNGNAESKNDELIGESLQPLVMKGRILLYTRLGCQESREARFFLHGKRLRYIEINIDVFPNRKLELEKIAGSPSVPRVFFNEIHIGGLSELKSLDEGGKLDEKIEYVIAEVPPFEAPLPPLSGEDDMSTSGVIDELAVIVHKMKESIPIKDRFYKMRRFTNSFLGSEAVNFLSEDQCLEREEAVEFGRKLASKLFFQHVLDENVFEYGHHLYRFLDHDPIVMSQCHNIPRGIAEVKPKAIAEISSRLISLCYASLKLTHQKMGNMLIIEVSMGVRNSQGI